MGGWKTYRLAELGTIARGKSKHRPRDAAFLYGGQYPFIQTGDIKEANHKLYKYTQTYSEEGLKQSKLWNAGTICITIAANIADTAILTFPACFPDSVIGFVPDKSKCDVDYMEYLLQHYKKNIQSHSIGSVQENINLGTFERIEFSIPPLAEQHRISSILSSLDDKIELNKQMNQTLEEMAQAMFKHYFVDGIDEGNLPKGWRLGKLGEDFDILMGQSPDGDSYNTNGNGTIFYQGRTDFTFRFPEVRMYTTEPKRMANKFDTLVSVRAPVGDVNMANERCCIGRGLSAVQHKTYKPSYTYYSMLALRSEFNKYEGEGTVFGSINKDNFANIVAVIPAASAIEIFEGKANLLDSLIHSNSQETACLIATRDYLLPKLISGEIIPADLKEIEQAI